MRGIILLLFLLVVIVGGMFLLSGQAEETPVETIEQPVELGGDAEE